MKIYNLLGYLLLAVAAYAFVNANNTDVIATAPVPVTEELNQSNPKSSYHHPNSQPTIRLESRRRTEN
ncbi:MAG TPA: hypothetical protein V6C71_12095 [Coleofasciculaceae cyanobacterium]|jgi:hypothetical protein